MNEKIQHEKVWFKISCQLDFSQNDVTSPANLCGSEKYLMLSKQKRFCYLVRIFIYWRFLQSTHIHLVVSIFASCFKQIWMYLFLPWFKSVRCIYVWSFVSIQFWLSTHSSPLSISVSTPSNEIHNIRDNDVSGCVKKAFLSHSFAAPQPLPPKTFSHKKSCWKSQLWKQSTLDCRRNTLRRTNNNKLEATENSLVCQKTLNVFIFKLWCSRFLLFAGWNSVKNKFLQSLWIRKMLQRNSKIKRKDCETTRPAQIWFMWI